MVFCAGTHERCLLLTVVGGGVGGSSPCQMQAPPATVASRALQEDSSFGSYHFGRGALRLVHFLAYLNLWLILHHQHRLS